MRRCLPCRLTLAEYCNFTCSHLRKAPPARQHGSLFPDEKTEPQKGRRVRKCSQDRQTWEPRSPLTSPGLLGLPWPLAMTLLTRWPRLGALASLSAVTVVPLHPRSPGVTRGSLSGVPRRKRPASARELAGAWAGPLTPVSGAPDSLVLSRNGASGARPWAAAAGNAEPVRAPGEDGFPRGSSQSAGQDCRVPRAGHGIPDLTRLSGFFVPFLWTLSFPGTGTKGLERPSVLFMVTQPAGS